MAAKKFVFSFITGIPLSFLMLFCFVDVFVISNWHLYSYKQFLLENTPGDKVVIYSGSNSNLGVNPKILEDYFQAPVINAADTGGWPLEHKLYQIMKYGKRGDIFILPLEWVHYAYSSDLPFDFIQGILDARISFYYRSLPLLQKAKFVLSQVSIDAYKKGLQTWTSTISSYQLQWQRAVSFVNSLRTNDRGSRRITGPLPIDPSVTTQTCDENLFVYQIRNGWKISDAFIENLKLAQQIQSKGIKLIFSWPVVVGNDCYQSPISKPLENYALKIRLLLQSHDILMIGQLNDSNFSERYLLDTYYHVKPEARDIRTQRLLNRLIDAGIKSFAIKRTMDDVQPYLVEKLEHIRLRYERLLTDKLPAWDGHEIGAPDFAKYIWFKKGWYEVESRGVWSENKVSVFSFKLPSKRYNSIFLNFSGVYFGEEEKTKILVNGEKIAEKPLVNTVIRIPEKLLKTPIITISLIHEEPVSPEELGQGKGNRKIKYGLTRLSWKVI